MASFEVPDSFELLHAFGFDDAFDDAFDDVFDDNNSYQGRYWTCVNVRVL